MSKAFRAIEEEGEIELTPELLGLFSPYRTNRCGPPVWVREQAANPHKA
ncbi:MAG: hypothetical protein ACI8PB_002533 [Desulforhopalus sp.]|jgi:hypothetical protein